MRQKLSFALFIFSLFFVFFGGGFLTAVMKLPPYELLMKAYKALPEITQYWENDLGLTPTRHLFAAAPGRKKFTIIDEPHFAEGYTLIAGLTPGKKTWLGVVLYDRTGREVHYWPIDYDQLDPDGPPPQNVYMHGVVIYEDGSLIVSFDDGNVLVKLSLNGDIMWKTPGHFHHQISKSFDGSIWTWEGEGRHQFMTQVNPENGQVIRRISLIDDVIIPQDLQGQFAIRTYKSENGLKWFHDPFHANDIEVLYPPMAKAFPAFAAGDLLISLRELNLVAVLDSRDYKVKWSTIGPWFRQHDADFLADGSIALLNNNMGFGKSHIMKVFPRTGMVETVGVEGSGVPFYTWQRGCQQHLENGNFLVTDSEHGRAFELSPRGELVWEFHNIYDEERNGVINKADRLPLNFFTPDVLREFGSPAVN